MIDFNRSNFNKLRQSLNSLDIGNILNKLLIKSNIINKFEILDISSIDTIRNQSLIFLKKPFDINFSKNKTVIITDDEECYKSFSNRDIILVSNFNKSYNILINYMYIHEDDHSYVDEFELVNNSYISKYSDINKTAKIGTGCVIGKGCKIGSYSNIKNNVVIKNTIIGNKVIISDNTTIGSSGFGFDLKNMGSDNLNPHIGIVFIDDFVTIGSNCTIDRGKIDVTFIGKYSMLDNLVHVAHNVHISEKACIAAQSGISGSVTIGKNVLVGGQSGFAGHIKIGDNVTVAAKSGVTKNILSNSVIAGFPAIDIKEWKNNLIKLKKKNV
tara:strand:- start:763 stop:1743 length:981 start_codon:yes stop_codon:yes gene_type:complete